MGISDAQDSIKRGKRFAKTYIPTTHPMKKLVLTLAMIGAAALQTAHALTIDFDSSTPPGVSFAGDYIVTNQSIGGLYAAPNPQSGNYYATYSSANPIVPSSSTITLGGTYKSLSFTWGSVDNYNTLELLRNGVIVDTVTGANALPPGSGDQGPAGTMTYTINGISFDSIKFLTGSNAFEVDNLKLSTSVPDGGATAALLGLAMLGLVAVRSKFSVV